MPATSWRPAWIAGALVALSILVPASILGFVAWQERQRVMREGEDGAQRAVSAMREHAIKVFDIQVVLLRQVERRVAGRDWAAIEADRELRRMLAEYAEGFGHVASIALVDARGTVRVVSPGEPARGDVVADRDFFRVHQEGHDGVFLSAGLTHPRSGEELLAVSLGRRGPGGRFEGVILISVPVGYFADFWEEFTSPPGRRVALVREDGALLIAHPAHGARTEVSAAFREHIRRSPVGLYSGVSRGDGLERMKPYAKVGEYPVFIRFSVGVREILASWERELLGLTAFGLFSAGALTALSVALLRSAARQQRAEERLREAQKMEALGRLTGGIAHDFNNLLQLLKNNLYLIDRRAEDPGAARAFARQASRAVQRGADLTSHLLAFARRQPLAPQAVDVTHLLRDAAALLHGTLAADIELVVAPAADTWPAMIDPNQAEMALLNLAVNARDAMPEGGTLVMRTENVIIGPRHEDPPLRPGDYVLLSVGDSGIGMDAANAKRAFEPFFTTKAAGKGSGLGLSQVHGFAAQSGGGVRIESRPRQGTTVKLFLPRAPAAPAAPAAAAPAAGHPRAGDGPLLLVDDDAAVRRTMAAALREAGYQVLESHGGADALERLRAEPHVSVLITDHLMPGMSGTDLATHARRLRPHLKVLLVTGYAELPDALAEAWQGTVLRKPVDPEVLQEHVARALA